MEVQKIFRDVGYLEIYIWAPNITFSRLDFIRYVLKLLRLEYMEAVERWVGDDLVGRGSRSSILVETNSRPAPG